MKLKLFCCLKYLQVKMVSPAIKYIGFTDLHVAGHVQEDSNFGPVKLEWQLFPSLMHDTFLDCNKIDSAKHFPAEVSVGLQFGKVQCTLSSSNSSTGSSPRVY